MCQRNNLNILDMKQQLTKVEKNMNHRTGDGALRGNGWMMGGKFLLKDLSISLPVFPVI